MLALAHRFDSLNFEKESYLLFSTRKSYGTSSKTSKMKSGQVTAKTRINTGVAFP